MCCVDIGRMLSSCCTRVCAGAALPSPVLAQITVAFCVLEVAPWCETFYNATKSMKCIMLDAGDGTSAHYPATFLWPVLIGTFVLVKEKVHTSQYWLSTQDISREEFAGYE